MVDWNDFDNVWKLDDLEYNRKSMYHAIYALSSNLEVHIQC